MWDIPSCLKRHKKKLLFIGGIIGGYTIFNAYLKRKLIEWESQRTTEICDQMKRAGHFENTMQHCDTVFIKFSSKIPSLVSQTVDVSSIIEKLKENPSEKVLLWEELKILVFTEALGQMYAQCLLCLLLKVQMSILSGSIFAYRFTNKESTEKLAKYLMCIESFLLNGVPNLLIRVRKIVEDRINPVLLQTQLKLEDIEQIVLDIQESMISDKSYFFQDIYRYLVPAGSSTAENDEFLDSIFLETKDVIECNDFQKVLQRFVQLGYSSIQGRLSECYVITGNAEDTFINPYLLSMPLAKLIPSMHKVHHQYLSSEKESLSHSLLREPSLNKFAANIYEAFSHKV